MDREPGLKSQSKVGRIRRTVTAFREVHFVAIILLVPENVMMLSKACENEDEDSSRMQWI